MCVCVCVCVCVCLCIHIYKQWGLVIATISDLRKPPENVSTNQNLALLATGVIWARYSTQIIPVNWSLFTVNTFVALTSGYQLFRKFMAHRKQQQVSSL